MAKAKKYQPTGPKGAKHFSVTVPTELLSQINKAAKAQGISRSYWMIEAAKAQLAK